MTNKIEPWERLLKSHDLFADLCDLFTPAFYISFAKRFDRHPHPIALVQGVHKTATAYVEAKWHKRVSQSQLLKFSGVHLLSAGLAARRMSYALAQISKSDRASQIVSFRYGKQLNERPLAQRLAKLGPQSRLTSLMETSAALEDAIASFLPLPDDPDEEKEYRSTALEFVKADNASTRQPLTKNHPMESAARAFQPVWTEFSTKQFARGRYKFDPPGYDSEAANALHDIVRTLDSTVPNSLAGTAIENVRKQLKDENRSD